MTEAGASSFKYSILRRTDGHELTLAVFSVSHRSQEQSPDDPR